MAQVCKRLFAAYVALLLIIWVMLLSWAAQAGWDSLSFWFPRAVEFIDPTAFVWVTGADPEFMKVLHPALLPIFLVIASSIESVFLLPAGVLMLVIFLLAIWLAACSVTSNRESTPRLTMSLILVSFTLPLGENHLLQIGYADLWLALGCVLSVLGFGSYLCEQNTMGFIQGVIGALLCVAIKDAGEIYGFIITVNFLLLWACYKLRLRSLLLAAIFAVPALTFMLANPRLLYESTGYTLGFSLDQWGRGVIIHGGRQLQLLEIQPVFPVFVSELERWVVNSSFSLSAVTFFILGVVVFRNKSIEAGLRRKLIYGWISTITLWLAMLALQLLTPKFFLYGTQGDTSMSRFELPVAILMALYIAQYATLLPSDFYASRASDSNTK